MSRYRHFHPLQNYLHHQYIPGITVNEHFSRNLINFIITLSHQRKRLRYRLFPTARAATAWSASCGAWGASFGVHLRFR